MIEDEDVVWLPCALEQLVPCATGVGRCRVCGRRVWYVPPPAGWELDRRVRLICTRPLDEADLDSCFARLVLAVN